MAGLRFNRRIQLRRFGEVDDGYQQVKDWSDHGSPIWSAREDMGADEKAAAGWIEATQAARFTVRSTAFTRGLTPKDRLTSGGVEFEIKGISEIGLRYRLQIVAIAKVAA